MDGGWIKSVDINLSLMFFLIELFGIYIGIEIVDSFVVGRCWISLVIMLISKKINKQIFIHPDSKKY